MRGLIQYELYKNHRITPRADVIPQTDNANLSGYRFYLLKYLVIVVQAGYEVNILQDAQNPAMVDAGFVLT